MPLGVHLLMRIKCQHCLKEMLSTSLGLHLRRVHGSPAISPVCVCGKIFGKVQSLNAHVRHCLVYREGVRPLYSGTPRPSPFKGMGLRDIVADPEATRMKLATAMRGRTKGIGATAEAEALRRFRLSLAATKRLEQDPHIKWYEVAGIKVQGGWEKQVAEKLVALGLEFSRPRLRYGSRHYTPDFYLPTLDLYIEVKGWFRDSDVRKTLLVLQEHNIDLRVILGGKALEDFTKGRVQIQELPRFNAIQMASLQLIGGLAQT